MSLCPPQAFHVTKTLKGNEVGRWLRTGDKGSVDVDGYLNLSGRFKEIINRGGEKISPFAIEVRAVTRRYAPLRAVTCRYGGEKISPFNIEVRGVTCRYVPLRAVACRRSMQRHCRRCLQRYGRRTRCTSPPQPNPCVRWQHALRRHPKIAIPDCHH